MSLFSVYRVISIPGKLKIETITAPFTGDLNFLSFAQTEIPLLMGKLSVTKDFKFKVIDEGLLWLETGSPTHRTSWNGWFLDASLLLRNGLGPSFKQLCLSLKVERLDIWFDFIVELGRKLPDFGGKNVKSS